MDFAPFMTSLTHRNRNLEEKTYEYRGSLTIIFIAASHDALLGTPYENKYMSMNATKDEKSEHENYQTQCIA